MNTGARRLAGIGIVTSALVAPAVSALAQPSRSSLTAVHDYVAGNVLAEDAAIPATLQVDPAYRALLESMLRRSATFRRQCLRIAAERRLTVHLELAAPFWVGESRAITHIVRQAGGRIDADIHIAPLTDPVELIAHEFEHVIEQLDQVDLAARAALPDAGVRKAPLDSRARAGSPPRDAFRQEPPASPDHADLPS